MLTDLASSRERRRFGAADMTLGIVVMAVLVVMIVPLPTWLLDVLLAANLAGSLTILLVALYASDGLKFAGFPTLLLLTTLVRLGLNVATTRLILLQADAGAVVKAFGDFVVRGDYLVGAVVFSILAIIQFVVIAKGSERVAEVGARFTLDAMPGKQLAIDSELRAGTIDGREATRRRRTLERESQFYGAMDGAMKFIKGDVVASFLITVINMLGGLGVGVLRRELPFTSALKQYGLLTIGDGLVTQIPALVLATAAGILVTRVASDVPNRPLATELGSQLSEAPQALIATAVFTGLLGLATGLPSWPFLLVSAGIAAIVVLQRSRRPAAAQPKSAPPAGIARGTAPISSGPAPRWMLEVGVALAPLITDRPRAGSGARPGLTNALTTARKLLRRDLGIPLPPATVHVGAALPPREACLYVDGLPEASFELPDPVTAAGAADFVLNRIVPVLKERAASFIGISATQGLLDELEQLEPVLVKHVIPRVVTVAVLTEVLRTLVAEAVSVRDLRAILESLAIAGSGSSDPGVLAETIRASRRRHLTHELTGGRGELEVCLLEPDLEDVVRGAIRTRKEKAVLALAPAARRDLIESVRTSLASAPRRPAALLTPADIRRFVWQLLHADLPHLRVISYAELEPATRITTVVMARLSN